MNNVQENDNQPRLGSDIQICSGLHYNVTTFQQTLAFKNSNDGPSNGCVPGSTAKYLKICIKLLLIFYLFRHCYTIRKSIICHNTIFFTIINFS